MAKEIVKISEGILNDPYFTSLRTIEDFVDRALVHCRTKQDIYSTLKHLTSKKMAIRVFDNLLAALEDDQSIPLTTPNTLTETEAENSLDYLAKTYDGFDKEYQLHQYLKIFLNHFGKRSGIKAINNRKAQFIEVIHLLLEFIAKKKAKARERRQETGQSVLDESLEYFSPEQAFRMYEEKRLNACDLVEELMVSSRDVKLVPIGEGKRFKSYRMGIYRRKDGKEFLDYSDIVLKVMKFQERSRNARKGLFATWKREHELVESYFGQAKMVPQTGFSKDEIIDSPNGENFFIVQEYVNGETILAACSDEYLTKDLGKILPIYISIYEQMEKTAKKVIDCASLSKTNVQVARSVDTNELVIKIIDTNNLIEVESALYNRMLVDKKSQERNHYLRTLKEFTQMGRLGNKKS